jgi:hypothetical protein
VKVSAKIFFSTEMIRRDIQPTLRAESTTGAIFPTLSHERAAYF